ncbi:hypothetical protein, partial [Corallococcus terminator]
MSLADHIPMWACIREQEVTAVVTPAMDYVGGFELQPRDITYESAEGIEEFGEALRSFLASVEDEAVLRFVYRVDGDCRERVDAHESILAQTTEPLLQQYVAGHLAWLRQQPMRRVRLYIFFCLKGPTHALARGALGRLLPFP